MAKRTARDELIKSMDGGEVCSNAFGKRFGERVCVGIKYPYIIHDGKKFKPTEEEKKGLKDDILLQEWGTTDLKKIMKMEGF